MVVTIIGFGDPVALLTKIKGLGGIILELFNVLDTTEMVLLKSHPLLGLVEHFLYRKPLLILVHQQIIGLLHVSLWDALWDGTHMFETSLSNFEVGLSTRLAHQELRGQGCALVHAVVVVEA